MTHKDAIRQGYAYSHEYRTLDADKMQRIKCTVYSKRLTPSCVASVTILEKQDATIYSNSQQRSDLCDHDR